MESGLPIRDLPVPAVVDAHGNRMLSLDAKLLFSTTAAVSTNWLGEFSNAVFAADLADMVRDARMDSISYAGLEDLGSFLNASLSAPIGYINDHLGYFRTSTQHNSADIMGRPWKLAHLAYITLAIAGRRLGKVSVEQAATCISALCPIIEKRYMHEADMADLCAVMPSLALGTPDAEKEFLSRWDAFIAEPISSLARPKISLFIPVFNGEQYIARTLDSALKQSFVDFEIICIDDCSEDSSLSILEAYAARDPRVRVLKMQTNMGTVPKVLNQALSEMRGKFFVYSSQDDLFSEDWLENMYTRAIESGADAVIPDLVFYHENDPTKNWSLVGLRGDRSVELSGREAVQHSLDWTIPGNALWSAALIKKLKFADFAMNSDEYSVRVFFINCNKVVFSEGQFLYRQDNEAAITKKITYKTFDMPYTFFRLHQFLKENEFPPEVCIREAAKSASSLQQLNQWLADNRDSMPEHEVQDAEMRAARCYQCLTDYKLLDLFKRQEDVRDTPVAVDSTSAGRPQ